MPTRRITSGNDSGEASGTPQVEARIEAIDTQKGTVEVLYIIPRCGLCGGKHRHRSGGVRVSGCHRGLYLVVA